MTAATTTATTPSPTIFIIEDDPIMAECVARIATSQTSPHLTMLNPANPAGQSEPSAPNIRIFADAISATAALDDALPDLVILDVLLSGPDGFTFLNEMISYPDTARIPVLIITSLDLTSLDLAHYGVRAIFSKETMTPSSLGQAIQAALSETAARPEVTPRQETTNRPEASSHQKTAANSPERSHAC